MDIRVWAKIFWLVINESRLPERSRVAGLEFTFQRFVDVLDHAP
jgi:hypothetical protein